MYTKYGRSRSFPHDNTDWSACWMTTGARSGVHNATYGTVLLYTSVLNTNIYANHYGTVRVPYRPTGYGTYGYRRLDPLRAGCCGTAVMSLPSTEVTSLGVGSNGTNFRCTYGTVVWFQAGHADNIGDQPQRDKEWTGNTPIRPKNRQCSCLTSENSKLRIIIGNAFEKVARELDIHQGSPFARESCI